MKMFCESHSLYLPGSWTVDNYKDQAEFVEHLEHGMFVDVLRSECLYEDPHGVVCLMESDNADQGFS